MKSRIFRFACGLGLLGCLAGLPAIAQDAPERKRRLSGAVDGRYDLLFVTPERFRSPLFRELLPKRSVSRLATPSRNSARACTAPSNAT